MNKREKAIQAIERIASKTKPRHTILYDNGDLAFDVTTVIDALSLPTIEDAIECIENMIASYPDFTEYQEAKRMAYRDVIEVLRRVELK